MTGGPRAARRSLSRVLDAQPAGRLLWSMRRAELDGIAFAFRVRAVAILVVSAWIATSVEWPRALYYLSLAGGFFVLGYIPYRWRHHPQGHRIKLGFVLLDVALVTAAVLVPPPAGLATGWPVQTRLRGQEFLFVVLLLAEAALTYSVVAVLWTGAAIAAIWSAGVQTIYDRPDTMRFADAIGADRADDATLIRLVFDPTFVSLGAWRTQLVATALFTGMLALAVWRSRRTLLAGVEAEIVRADLARYVSPDVAQRLAADAPKGFGDPATRVVAVLFADIVGFTAITETLTPERTFALLRSFQSRGCAMVFRHGGTLDKYLGDGFMATFGTLGDQPDAPARAVACAFDLRDEMARWNAKRAGRGLPPIALSVGVHCGPVVAGNMGADSRIEFTVVGDVVNVASRLEQATRDAGACIAVSDGCLEAAGAERWRPRFDRSLELTLRGRAGSVTVHLGAHPAASGAG